MLRANIGEEAAHLMRCAKESKWQHERTQLGIAIFTISTQMTK